MGQVEVADDGVVEELDAGGVDADVVGGPSPAEVLASGGELPDDEGSAEYVSSYRLLACSVRGNGPDLL